MVIIIGTEVELHEGVVPEVVAVTVSCAICGELPESFHVMEAGLAVGFAMMALAAGETFQEYVDDGPPGSTVYKEGVGKSWHTGEGVEVVNVATGMGLIKTAYSVCGPEQEPEVADSEATIVKVMVFCEVVELPGVNEKIGLEFPLAGGQFVIGGSHKEVQL